MASKPSSARVLTDSDRQTIMASERTQLAIGREPQSYLLRLPEPRNDRLLLRREQRRASHAHFELDDAILQRRRVAAADELQREDCPHEADSRGQPGGQAAAEGETQDGNDQKHEADPGQPRLVPVCRVRLRSHTFEYATTSIVVQAFRPAVTALT